MVTYAEFLTFLPGEFSVQITGLFRCKSTPSGHIALRTEIPHALWMSDELSIRHELRCGDLGRIVSLHGKAYEPLGGYGLRFEAFVAQTIADFILHNDAHGRIWLAERSGALVGSSAIVLHENGTGQLRWVVVDPAERGDGLGKDLVARALAYCRDQGCRSVHLETTDGLPESEDMYNKLGFYITSNTIEELWDGTRPLIRMQLDLA